MYACTPPSPAYFVLIGSLAITISWLARSRLPNCTPAARPAGEASDDTVPLVRRITVR